MLRPKFINVLFYLFVKYMAFGVCLAGRDDRFKMLVIDQSVTKKEYFINTFHYFNYVLIFAIFFTAIFSLPIYFSFKIKKPYLFLVLLIILFVLEYLFYSFMVSPENSINGIFNLVIGVFFLLIFFFKEIKNKFLK